jgi:hypothetical protein
LLSDQRAIGLDDKRRQLSKHEKEALISFANRLLKGKAEETGRLMGLLE